MTTSEPETILHAGELIFPDVIHPWPLRLLAAAALVWMMFGPLVVYAGARRGRTTRGVAIYAAGLIVAIATIMTIEWGWPFSDSIGHRFWVLFRHIVWNLATPGIGLAVIAALVGNWRRRRVRKIAPSQSD